MNSPDLSKRHFLNQSLQLAKQAGAFYAVNAVSQPFNTLRWVLQESIPQEEQAIEPSDVFAETLLPDAYYGVPLRQVDLGVTPAGQLFATTLTYEEIDGKRYDSLIINDINEPSPDQPEFGVTETVVRFLREGGQPWTSTIKTTRLNDTTVGTTYYDPVRQQHVLEFYHKSPPGWSKGDTIEVRNQDYPDAYRDLINGQNQVLRTDSLPHAALVLTHDVITEGTMVLISDTLTIIKPDGTEDVRYFVKDFTILKKTGSVVVRSVDGTFEHFSIDSDGTLHELAAPATDFIFDHSARMFDTCDEDELVSIVADNNRKLHTFEYSQETDEWREYSVHDLSHLDYPDHPG
ncbi:hypothetical protein HY468_03505, partial [Candidatus Roizmanbacteria bacterium]|nr:hypothetical protein [Candidatus Roizmanbacteria bacterium]